MKRDLFRRYVWLIDTLCRAKKMTFDEVAESWMQSPMNYDRQPLALRTFHNHRDQIEDLFGIRILCDRKGHSYYVDDFPTNGSLYNTPMKVWMLQTLSLPSTNVPAKAIKERVVIDGTPEEKFWLPMIIDALNENRYLHMKYRGTKEQADCVMAPYCVRFWGRRWYLLAKDRDTAVLKIFDIERISDMELMDSYFVYDPYFSPIDFFRNYFGMDINLNDEPMNIKLRIGGSSRELVRSMPLHSTQRESGVTDEHSIFEFYFAPGDQFKRTILSMGADVEVVEPAAFRDSIGDYIRDMAANYA